MKGNTLITILGLAGLIGGVAYFWKDIARPAIKGKKTPATDTDPAVAATAEETAAFTGTAIAGASYITPAEAGYDQVNQSVLRQGTY